VGASVPGTLTESEMLYEENFFNKSTARYVKKALENGVSLCIGAALRNLKGSSFTEILKDR